MAVLCRSVFSLALMVGLGLLVGFRSPATLPPSLLGMLLVFAFGYAYSGVYATIGLLTKDPETAHVAGILAFFILMCASSAIVPVDMMPSWLQPFAANQPFSVTVDAVRALIAGADVHDLVWQSLAWSAGIVAAVFCVSVRLSRHVTS